MPTPLYGGDGRLTTGVLRLQALFCRGDSMGGDPVIVWMSKGDGFGLTDRGFGVSVCVGAFSRGGGGVRGDSGGGEGSGDLCGYGDFCWGGCCGDEDRGDLERDRCFSSRRLSSASSSRRLLLVSSVTRWRGADGGLSCESSEGGEGERGPRSGGHSAGPGAGGGAGASGVSGGRRARADR